MKYQFDLSGGPSEPLYGKDGALVYVQRFPRSLNWARAKCKALDQCERKTHFDDFDRARMAMAIFKHHLKKRKKQDAPELNVYPCEFCGRYVMGNMPDPEIRAETEYFILRKEGRRLIGDLLYILRDRAEELSTP